MHLRELDANLIVILDALLLDASVTKAAERLGRSPSAVSHALARLREIFDDPLFVRAGQRLVPTSRATQLAPTVHIIVSGLEGLLRRQNEFEPMQQQRRFMLACRDIFELTLLPAMRAELAELAPGIALERLDAPAGHVVEALRAGRAQFALVEGPAEAEANDISVETLFRDPYVFLAPERHPLAGTVIGTAAMAADGPAIIADTLHAETLFETSQPRPGNLEMAASPLIAVHAALERGAIALVPERFSTIARRHTGMRVLRTDLDLPPLAVHLLWHVSQERDECHSWLRDRLRCQTASSGEASPEGSEPAITA
ncbi:MAG: LysR family transcriptional regulator [Dichotomicrobium sp.]